MKEHDHRRKHAFNRDDAIRIAHAAAERRPQAEHMAPKWQPPEWVVDAIEAAHRDVISVTEEQFIALVAGPANYHHKMDHAQECAAKAFDRCRDMTIQNIRIHFEARRAMTAACTGDGS